MPDKNEVIFPFKVDVEAFPQRRWIRASRLFVYFISFNLILSCVIATLFLFFANSKNTTPVFLHFSNKNNKFQNVNFKTNENKNEQLSLKDTLIKSFITDYLNTRYKASKLTAYNEYNWCNCKADFNKVLIANSSKKRNKLKCSLCLMSSNEVFEAFTNKEKAAVLNDVKSFGSVENIEILQINSVFKSDKRYAKQEYQIYKVETKIKYQNSFKKINFYIGVEDVIKENPAAKSFFNKVFGLNEISIPEKLNYVPENYLFQVISFSQEAVTGDK